MVVVVVGRTVVVVVGATVVVVVGATVVVVGSAVVVVLTFVQVPSPQENQPLYAEVIHRVPGAAGMLMLKAELLIVSPAAG